MGHDENDAFRRRVRQYTDGVLNLMQRDVLWHRARKGVRTRIDPTDIEWKRRQRQNQGATDVSGAEEVDAAAMLAKTLLDAAPGDQARDGEMPLGFSLGKLLHARDAARCKCFHRQLDAAPTALAELGAERMGGDARCLAWTDHCLCRRDGAPLERAAAD